MNQEEIMRNEEVEENIEEWLLRHIYPESRSAYYRDTYTKLRSFLEANGRYPSEYQDRGKKRSIKDPERRLAIDMQTIREGSGTPAERQFMERLPGWTWPWTRR